MEDKRTIGLIWVCGLLVGVIIALIIYGAHIPRNHVTGVVRGAKFTTETACIQGVTYMYPEMTPLFNTESKVVLCEEKTTNEHN